MRSPVLRFVVTALAVFLSKACENCILDDPGMTGPPSHKKAEELFSACACDSTCDKEMMQEVVDSYFMDPGGREQEFVWNEAKAGWVTNKGKIQRLACLACIDRTDRRIECTKEHGDKFQNVPNVTAKLPIIREICSNGPDSCYMMCYGQCKNTPGTEHHGHLGRMYASDEMEVNSKSGGGSSMMTIIIALLLICVCCCCMRAYNKNGEAWKDKWQAFQLSRKG